MLFRIRRLILKGQYLFTEKADTEILLSSITREDVLEAIMNARQVDKTMRTTSFGKTHKNEKVYVIRGFTYNNILIYTKGTIKIVDGKEVLYRLISAKREGMF